MASAFARSARHSFRAGSAAFRSSTRRPSPATATSRHLLQNKVPQRRFLQSVIPLHNAVASAKLVSHLSTSSRSRSALSLGLQGYVNVCFNMLRNFKGASGCLI